MANVLSSFYNSVDLAYIDLINENTFDWEDGFNLKFWTERSPVYSFYRDDMNFVFEGNDTIFKYDLLSRKLEHEYILHTRVDDMFETSKYIYISIGGKREHLLFSKV